MGGGSGLATFGIPLSSGVPYDFIRHTITIERDLAAIRGVFARYGDQIAAVIVEPVGGNYGVIVSDPIFLFYLREITKAYGALLIFDEVIPGIRFRVGSVSELVGVKPDLYCLGRIIGGGLPIGAYGGSD